MDSLRYILYEEAAAVAAINYPVNYSLESQAVYKNIASRSSNEFFFF